MASIFGNSGFKLHEHYFYFYSKGHIPEYHSEKLTQLREAFELSKMKKVDIKLTSVSCALDEVSKM